jgi:hypothetical protein
LSTKPCTAKVANTAPSETKRADEIAIGTAKTGKVTAVVMELSIFTKKRCNLWSAKSGNQKPSRQKTESADIPKEKSSRLRSLSQKTRKGWSPKKLASKSNKLELNSTNLELKSKKTCSDCAKKHDPSASSGLKVKTRQLGSCLTLDQVGTSFL